MRLSLTPEFARVLNFAGLMAMLAVLLGAYVYQFAYRELPCTLCLLQRVAMMGVAFGAAMNLTLGPHPRHYGVCLVSAVAGGAVSIRQTMLHVNPFFDTATGVPSTRMGENPAFGEPVLGYHLYVWGILLFGAVFLVVGLVQLFEGQFEERGREPAWLTRLASFGVGLLFLVTLFETGTTFLECGLGDCPNDGGWNWWFLR